MSFGEDDPDVFSVDKLDDESNHSVEENSYPSSKVFLDRLNCFINKKGEMLFQSLNLRSCTAAQGIYFHESLDPLSTENYTTVPPLEIFMDVPKPAQINHFYKSIERGKVVTGVINSLVDSGFYMNLVGVDAGHSRNVAEWKISAFCPAREIPVSSSHEDPLALFVVKDKVRAVVTKVIEDKITISLHSHHLSNCLSDVKLGIITDEEVSLYYSRTQECQERSYEEVLRNSLEYENPSNTANLALMFGLCNLETRPSLMEGLHSIRYDKKEYAEYLRKSQSHRLAMINVKEALRYFKGNKTLEAMQMTNKALDIDPYNVEALVIRGALYANCESYSKAIEDFDDALKYEPGHANALKYLIQVLIAYAKSKIIDDQLVPAKKLLDRAIELNSHHVDRDVSKTINDLLSDIHHMKNHLDKRHNSSRDRDKRLDGSFGDKNSRSDRRLSFGSLHNAVPRLKYYSPVYCNDGDEAYGPEPPPPAVQKTSKNNKKRRSHSSGSSCIQRSSRKSPEPSSKKRKLSGKHRFSSSSSSSTTSSSSSSSSSSESSMHKSPLEERHQSCLKFPKTKTESLSKVVPPKAYELDRVAKSCSSSESSLKRVTKNMIDSGICQIGKVQSAKKAHIDRGQQERRISLQIISPLRSAHQENLAFVGKGEQGETLEDMEHFLRELKCKQKKPKNV